MCFVDKRIMFGTRRLLMWKSLRAISLRLRYNAAMLSKKMNNDVKYE